MVRRSIVESSGYVLGITFQVSLAGQVYLELSSYHTVCPDMGHAIGVTVTVARSSDPMSSHAGGRSCSGSVTRPRNSSWPRLLSRRRPGRGRAAGGRFELQRSPFKLPVSWLISQCDLLKVSEMSRRTVTDAEVNLRRFCARLPDSDTLYELFQPLCR